MATWVPTTGVRSSGAEFLATSEVLPRVLSNILEATVDETVARAGVVLTSMALSLWPIELRSGFPSPILLSPMVIPELNLEAVVGLAVSRDFSDLVGRTDQSDDFPDREGECSATLFSDLISARLWLDQALAGLAPMENLLLLRSASDFCCSVLGCSGFVLIESKLNCAPDLSSRSEFLVVPSSKLGLVLSVGELWKE